MQFKKLEIEQEANWIKRTLTSSRFKKSVIAITLGAITGFCFYYFTEGRLIGGMSWEDITRSMLLGGLFGFFITNSPCARGRC